MKLKVYVLVSCIAIIGCFLSKAEAIMEDKILGFLEEIRNRMCYPLFGFPALDPLLIEQAHVSMDNEYIVDFTTSVKDFRLTGLSDFNVTKLKISAIPLRRSNLNIVLPLTTVKSLYTAKGSLAYILYLNGNGKAEGHIDDIRLSISWVLKTGLTVGIRNLNIKVTIGSLFVDIENLVEEPRVNDFVHALMNEIGIELLNDLWLEAQDKGVTKYVENVINKYLEKYTLADILKIINDITGGEEPQFGGAPANCKIKVLR